MNSYTEVLVTNKITISETSQNKDNNIHDTISKINFRVTFLIFFTNLFKLFHKLSMKGTHTRNHTIK